VLFKTIPNVRCPSAQAGECVIRIRAWVVALCCVGCAAANSREVDVATSSCRSARIEGATRDSAACVEIRRAFPAAESGSSYVEAVEHIDQMIEEEVKLLLRGRTELKESVGTPAHAVSREEVKESELRLLSLVLRRNVVVACYEAE